MPNNRHRLVAKLRTSEERERCVLNQMSDILGEELTTIEEAQNVVDSWFAEIVNKVKEVFK